MAPKAKQFWRSEVVKRIAEHDELLWQVVRRLDRLERVGMLRRIFRRIW